MQHGAWWCMQAAYGILLCTLTIPVFASWGIPLAYGTAVATPLITPLVGWLIGWGILTAGCALLGLGYTPCCWVFSKSVACLEFFVSLPAPSCTTWCLPAAPLFIGMGIALGTVLLAHYRPLRAHPLLFCLSAFVWGVLAVGSMLVWKETHPVLYEDGRTVLLITPTEGGLQVTDMSPRTSRTDYALWYVYTLRPFCIKTFGEQRIRRWDIIKPTRGLIQRRDTLRAYGWIIQETGGTECRP